MSYTFPCIGGHCVWFYIVKSLVQGWNKFDPILLTAKIYLIRKFYPLHLS